MAGEVYCVPVAGSAEGKVVEPITFFRGKEVFNLTLTFAGGKLASIAGSGPGFADLKATYDVASAGKETFAFVDFGINPDLRIWPSSKLGNWVQSGMISVGIGGNLWAGGENRNPYGLINHLAGTTVTVDEKKIIEKGELKI
jgi:aminopeptidase